MKIELNIANTDNIGAVSKEDVAHFEEIVAALITSGGLTGVKGGKTIIHFGPGGEFMSIQLDYYPWRRKKA
jgi:hypothetical protein